jgi:hypothetical protein
MRGGTAIITLPPRCSALSGEAMVRPRPHAWSMTRVRTASMPVSASQRSSGSDAVADTIDGVP